MRALRAQAGKRILAISGRTLRSLALRRVGFGKNLSEKPWFDPHDFAEPLTRFEGVAEGEKQ
jgi:hypothetical protein